MFHFLSNVHSRCQEYKADDYASRLGFTAEVKTALIKMELHNLDFPVDDWLYAAWNYSHPTILSRIEAIEK